MKTLISFFVLLFTIALTAQDYEWNTVATGAGGWMTGLDIHPSGDPVYARSDVGGAYRLDVESGEWENIVTANNLPESDVYWNRFAGVLSIVSAPSNPDRTYLAYFDGIYSSKNRGDSWSRTSFPTTIMSANSDDSKYSGERLAVDPLDEGVVYFGTIDKGLWKTEDGGLNWSQVIPIPLGLENRGVRQVVFDTSSEAIDGKTSTIYVTVDGVDVFRTNDAGENWSSLSFDSVMNEAIFLDADVDANGHFYCVGRNQNFETFGIQKFNGTDWLSVQNNGTIYFNLAIDPFNSDRVIALSEGFTETALTNNVNVASPTWS